MQSPSLCHPLLNIVFPPLLLLLFTVSCRVVFAKPQDLETWLNHLSFHFLTKVRSSLISPVEAWIFLRTFSLVTWFLYKMFSNLRWLAISKVCILFSLLPWFMTHRIGQGCTSVSPLIQVICCYISVLASALSELQWLVQSLKDPLVLSLHRSCYKVLEA